MQGRREEFAVTKGKAGLRSQALSMTQVLANVDKGVPFSTKLFREQGLTSKEIYRVVSRLLNAGVLRRACRGFYFQPSGSLSYLGLEAFPSPAKIAKSWASERGYILVAQGVEEAYRMGFQAQAPVMDVFWTNGPTREFHVGNAVAIVKHKASSRLLWAEEPVGRLYRALLVAPVSGRSEAQLRNALNQCFGERVAAEDALNKLAKQATLKRWLWVITQERDRLLSY